MSILKIENMHDIADLSQICGVIVGVITLLFVYRQIRDAAKALRATAYQNMTEHVTSISSAIIVNPELAAFVQNVGRNEFYLLRRM